MCLPRFTSILVLMFLKLKHYKTHTIQVFGNGGAVYCLNGTFRMSGGEIANNSVTATAGAVVFASTFKKTGGIIYGNEEVAVNLGKANTGGQYVMKGACSNGTDHMRNTTADANVTLDSSTTDNWE
jgi:hypothetical protein